MKWYKESERVWSMKLKLSNHLTITQLLCEQISIIPNLSKWILEQQNRLENSVPQREVGNSTNEMAGREVEKPMLAKVRRAPETTDHHSPKKQYYTNILPSYYKWQSSVVQTKGWFTPSFTLKSLLSNDSLHRDKPQSHQCSSTLSPPFQDALFHPLYICSPNSYIKTWFHFHPYYQVSISL